MLPLRLRLVAVLVVAVARSRGSSNSDGEPAGRLLRASEPQAPQHGAELAEWVRSQHLEHNLSDAAWDRERHELGPAPPGFNGSRPFPVCARRAPRSHAARPVRTVTRGRRRGAASILMRIAGVEQQAPRCSD